MESMCSSSARAALATPWAYQGELDHPEFEAAISRVAQAGRQSGKALGVLVPRLDEVPRFFDQLSAD